MKIIPLKVWKSYRRKYGNKHLIILIKTILKIVILILFFQTKRKRGVPAPPILLTDFRSNG